jgi:hypothetical protein
MCDQDVDMDSVTMRVAEFKVAESIDDRIILLEQKVMNLTEEIARRDREHVLIIHKVADNIISASFKKEYDTSPIESLLDLFPGRDLSHLKMDAASTIVTESNLFERLVEQKYDLRNMTCIKSKIIELIELNHLAPWYEKCEIMLMRVIALARANWPDARKKYLKWDKILAKFVEWEDVDGDMINDTLEEIPSERSTRWRQLVAEMKVAITSQL